MLSTIVALSGVAIATIAACFAAYWARRAHKTAMSAYYTVTQRDKKAVSEARLAEIEAVHTELSDSYAHLLRSFKKLSARNATRMARERKREEENGSLEVSDKDALRLHAKQKGLI